MGSAVCPKATTGKQTIAKRNNFVIKDFLSHNKWNRYGFSRRFRVCQSDTLEIQCQLDCGSAWARTVGAKGTTLAVPAGPREPVDLVFRQAGVVTAEGQSRLGRWAHSAGLGRHRV